MVAERFLYIKNTIVYFTVIPCHISPSDHKRDIFTNSKVMRENTNFFVIMRWNIVHDGLKSTYFLFIFPYVSTFNNKCSWNVETSAIHWNMWHNVMSLCPCLKLISFFFLVISIRIFKNYFQLSILYHALNCSNHSESLAYRILLVPETPVTSEIVQGWSLLPLWYTWKNCTSLSRHHTPLTSWAIRLDRWTTV